MKLTHTSATFLAGLTLVSALALTACNGDDGSMDAAPAGSSSSASTGGNGGSGSGDPDQGSSSKGSSTGNSSDGNSKASGNGGDEGTLAGTGSNKQSVGICRSDELEVSAADNTTDKEEGVVTVQFKNGGGRDCTISGFAGVDLKTASGDTMSVERNGDKPRPDVLKDGESAAFNITFPVNNTGGSGVRVSKILVTPPNETKTVTIAWPAGSLPAENPDSQSTNRPIRISPLGKVSDSPAG
ncbi:DUF4232 domain-containing protein [Streptomyces atratus]|uniref:DUF4232 domain-containing protein n=1 Tax=Streptomyces atratus TaxID=1893 RepID=UPI002256F5B8|nr:DUF4232 domain-containing protein [Streptomyces atratus]MCX5342895.1 DUF4232 domain-containing protein [Streptomyces atratus]